MTKTGDVWKKVKINEQDEPINLLLGPVNADSMINDPKHLMFSISRYKFASKMMPDCQHILEVGCGEGIGAFVYARDTAAKKITGIDLDPVQIDYAREHVQPLLDGKAHFLCQDLITTPYAGEKADGLVSIDVIEHVHPEEDDTFWKNTLACLTPQGIAVFGTPNALAQEHASFRSQLGHINLYSPDRLVATLKKYFTHVFLFSMNDEMVHTGFNKLAHYLLALCVK